MGRATWGVGRTSLVVGTMMLVTGCGAEQARPSLAPSAVPMQRLTPLEYNNSLRDLFGASTVERLGVWDDDEFTPAFPLPLPPDAKIEGFEGMVEGQTVSPWLVEQYALLAEQVAPLALQSPLFFPCADITRLAGEEAQTCAWQGVARFAARAWRRSLTSEEMTALEALWSEARGGMSVEEAVTAVVEAILQSPSFLYRMRDAATPSSGPEPEPEPLDPFTLASRMSYLLWDSMPDEQLFEAAATGRLDTPGQVAAEARRMLRDPKARDAVARFHEQWLGLDKLYGINFDRAAYSPRYAPNLQGWLDREGESFQDLEEYWSAIVIGARAAMLAEAREFTSDVVFDRGGKLSDLFTDHRGYAWKVFSGDEPVLDSQLLTWEGRGTPLGTGGKTIETFDGNLGFRIRLTKVAWPQDQRAGVLTLPAWLASGSHPVHPGPILRGVGMLERIACERMGQPPAEAAGTAPPDTLADHSTNRERLESITSAPLCQACHQSINGVGFAFEHYDSLGGYRVEDAGQPVDATGSWTPLDGGPAITFTDAVDLSRQLAAHPTIERCYVRQWTRYALGVDIPDGDPHLERLQSDFTSEGGNVLKFLEDLVSSDLFRLQATEEVP